jgi:stage V sporulation protein B
MLNAVLSILGTRILTRLTTMGAGILIARTIGVEEQGVLGLLLMLGGLLTGICDLGIGMGAVYFVGRKSWDEGRYTGLALPVLATSTALTLGGFTCVAVLGLTDYAVALEGRNLAALILFVVANSFAELYFNLLIARQRLRDYNLGEVLFAVLMLTGAVLLITQGARVAAFYFALYGATRGLVFLFLYARLGVRPRGGRLADLTPVLRYSLSQWSANMFALLSVRADVLMLAWFIPRTPRVTLADLGLYTICLLTITRLMEIQRSIQTAYFSHLAGLGEQEAITAANATYRKSFLVYLLLSLVLIVFGYPVLLLYGREYTAAWGVLTVLVLGTVTLRGNSGVLMLYFSSVDRSRYTVHTHQISLVGNLLFSCVLIPRLGIMGAAVGTAVSFTLGKVYLLWRYQRLTGSRWSRDLLLRPGEAVSSLKELKKGVAAFLGGRPA